MESPPTERVLRREAKSIRQVRLNRMDPKPPPVERQLLIPPVWLPPAATRSQNPLGPGGGRVDEMPLWPVEVDPVVHKEAHARPNGQHALS